MFCFQIIWNCLENEKTGPLSVFLTLQNISSDNQIYFPTPSPQVGEGEISKSSLYIAQRYRIGFRLTRA